MIPLTRDDIIFGPGIDTGRERRGTFVQKSNYRNSIELRTLFGESYFIRHDEAFVVKGSAHLPIVEINGKLCYGTEENTNNSYSFLLKRES